ncbi:hypothetical protein ACJX0J_012520, partial [Zea mays]
LDKLHYHGLNHLYNTLQRAHSKMFFLFFLEYLIHFIQHQTLEIKGKNSRTFMLWLRKIEGHKNVKQQATLLFLAYLKFIKKIYQDESIYIQIWLNRTFMLWLRKIEGHKNVKQQATLLFLAYLKVPSLLRKYTRFV